MMTQRRTFTAEFKTQVVLDLVSGAHSAAELCRQHQLNPQLLSRWKTEFLERAALVFEQDQQRSAEQERIAELERLVGRLTMELDIAKKASTLLSSPLARNGR
jgi:transposase